MRNTGSNPGNVASHRPTHRSVLPPFLTHRYAVPPPPGGGYKKKRGDHGVIPSIGLKLRFNSFVVVGVGAGIAFAKHLAFGDLADEQHMAAQIQLFLDLTTKHCVGVFGEVGKSVMAAGKAYEIRKLVHIPAGLHTEVTDGFKGNILGENTHIELAGVLDHLTGQIAHLDGHRQPGGICRHLQAGVGDTTVILAILTGEHEQTVGQPVHRGRILRRFLLLSESSGPADPSEPCRDKPHIYFI